MSQRRKIVILVGPPGSGKGTLSSLCIERHAWHQLSTGNLCRKHVAEKTPIGQEIDFASKSGKLVSDTVILQMVREWLMDQPALGKPIIFDGFPRTLAQAEALDEILNEDSRFEVLIVHMKLNDEVIIQRLSRRLVCTNSACQAVYSDNYRSCVPRSLTICDKCKHELKRRADDQESVVKNRLQQYQEHTMPLLGSYRLQNKLVIDLDVNKPIEEVFGQLVCLVEPVKL